MLKSLNLQDLRQKMIEATDKRVRSITAGLGINELRAVMRGDPPTEKPNPRYKVHTTSFLFHIRPRYYELGSTIFTHTWRLGFFTAFFLLRGAFHRADPDGLLHPLAGESLRLDHRADDERPLRDRKSVV